MADIRHRDGVEQVRARQTVIGPVLKTARSAMVGVPTVMVTVASVLLAMHH